jgi:phosphoribosyl 1,2-cyclic phosphodiesterase
MSLFISALASGSNGNCYYIGNSKEAVLVDAGISCRETEKRMKRLGLNMQTVKAIFISHEHADHIRGLSILSSKYQLPVYITTPTLRNGRLGINKSLIRSFHPHEPVSIGSLSIHPFPKLHDAADPYSFIVAHNGIRVGVFTDIGAPCAHVTSHFAQCHAAFLESNYDEEMLEKGGYPFYLKRRIRGGNGHLSNRQALELFLTHRPNYLSHLILSHLSGNNNCPDLVQQLFHPHSGSSTIVVASRHEETPVFSIRSERTISTFDHHSVKPVQMELEWG